MSDVAPVTWLQFGDQVKRLMALREIDGFTVPETSKKSMDLRD